MVSPSVIGRPVKGHAFRWRTSDESVWQRIWECECGHPIGRQPVVGHQKARRLHREHKAEVVTNDG